MNILKKSGFLSSVIVLSAAMSGCATTEVVAPQEGLSKIKRVAVASFVGNKLTRQVVGMTVFNNDKEEVDIASWGVDAAFEGQVTKVLSGIPGMEVIKADIPTAEFSHVNDLTGPYEAPAFWGPNWGAIEPSVKKVCSANALDGIVVLARQNETDVLGGTNQWIRAIGVYGRGAISVLHVGAWVGVYNCGTGKVMAVKALQPGASGDSVNGRILAKPVTAGLPRTPSSSWSDETKAQLKTQLLDMTEGGWERALKKIFGRA